MTVLDLEENIIIKSAGFFGNLCVDVSDHIAIYDNSAFSVEISHKARAAGKRRYCGPFQSGERHRGRIQSALSATWRVLSTQTHS